MERKSGDETAFAEKNDGGWNWGVQVVKVPDQAHIHPHGWQTQNAWAEKKWTTFMEILIIKEAKNWALFSTPIDGEEEENLTVNRKIRELVSQYVNKSDTSFSPQNRLLKLKNSWYSKLDGKMSFRRSLSANPATETKVRKH